MPNIEPPGGVPGVSDSQGIVIGSGNTQHNTWAHKPPLDPVAMGGLNPHVAVARLQRLSHNELVDFFATAMTGDVSEIFDVFLEVDEAKVVAVLGDISRRKATELIESLDPAAPWLIWLPQAVEEISNKAKALKWIHAGTGGSLRRFADGYIRAYEGGRILWCSEYDDAYSVRGEIEEFWIENSALLEFPEGESETVQKSPLGTGGIRQPFQGITVFSSKHGVYAVDQQIMQCYEAEGGNVGWLGFPIASDKGNGDGVVQRFEGGIIHWHYVAGVYAVRQAVEGALLSGQKWHPISKESSAESVTGKLGVFQQFESGPRKSAVYSHEGRSHPVMVAPEIWSYYSNLSAEKSWLGFPARQQLEFTNPDYKLHPFECGTIYWRHETGPIAVPAAVVNLIKQLGAPVSEEQSVGTDGSGSIQYFEKGVVTMRDGKRETWYRDTAPTIPGSPSQSNPPAGKPDDTQGAAVPFPRIRNPSRGRSHGQARE